MTLVNNDGTQCAPNGTSLISSYHRTAGTHALGWDSLDIMKLLPSQHENPLKDPHTNPDDANHVLCTTTNHKSHTIASNGNVGATLTLGTTSDCGHGDWRRQRWQVINKRPRGGISDQGQPGPLAARPPATTVAGKRAPGPTTIGKAMWRSLAERHHTRRAPVLYIGRAAT